MTFKFLAQGEAGSRWSHAWEGRRHDGRGWFEGGRVAAQGCGGGTGGNHHHPPPLLAFLLPLAHTLFPFPAQRTTESQQIAQLGGKVPFF